MNLFGKNPHDDLVVIAEIGVNHEGGLDYAKELVRLAASTGADAVKFQSYSPERFISRENEERFADGRSAGHTNAQTTPPPS